jgi:predicted AAA+ superfamily ATPase
MYYQRLQQQKLIKLGQMYPVVLVTGPRQTGKTELIKNEFPGHRWVLLDSPQLVSQAREDPELFLINRPPPVFLDEIQRTKELFLQIKSSVDLNKPKSGSYLLSGSQPFKLMANVSESLAGRIGILELLPFTPSEMTQRSERVTDLDTLLSAPPIGSAASLPYPPNEFMLRGGLPAMALRDISEDETAASQRLRDYVLTFVTKDVREISAIKDLGRFEKFLRTLAIYSSKTFNLSEIGRDIGLRQSTLGDWQSILESSYLMWKIPGYSKKLGKRESKIPKVVLIDCGLQASLLGYEQSSQIDVSPLKGAIFETGVLNAIRSTLGRDKNVFYWRKNEDCEVDCVIENKFDDPVPIEIKHTSKPNADDLRGLRAFIEAYPQTRHGILITLAEECFWLDKNILHVPFGML